MDEIFLKRIESSTCVLLMKGRTFWTVIELTWEESIFNKLIEAKSIVTTFYGDIVTSYKALEICQLFHRFVYSISLSWRCKTTNELFIPDLVPSNNNCWIIQSWCTKYRLNKKMYKWALFAEYAANKSTSKEISEIQKSPFNKFVHWKKLFLTLYGNTVLTTVGRLYLPLRRVE